MSKEPSTWVILNVNPPKLKASAKSSKSCRQGFSTANLMIPVLKPSLELLSPLQ